MRILESRSAIAEEAAEACCALVRERPECVLGLATGNTQRELYRCLAERYRAGRVDFSRVTTFNLDEYLGLPESHAASFHHYMRIHLFDHVNLDPARTHLPEAQPPDPQAAADRYEAAIRAAGGIDLQFLGIGRNGHVGFNEPTSSLGSRTRIKTLTRTTLADTVDAFGDESPPRVAITVGVATILEARRIVLLASGSAKAQALRAAVEGPLSASCPASALQLHPDTLVLADPEAAGELRLREYYEDVARQRARLADE